MRDNTISEEDQPSLPEVPWVQIMENEFECLVVRWGDGGHFAEKFVKKYCS